MTPEGWKTVRIGDIAQVKGGKRMPKGRPFAEGKTPYPYIRVSDFDNGTVNAESLKYVLPDDRDKIKSYTISYNDLYISIAGTIGLVGTVPMELDGAQLTENAAKICLKSKTDVERDYIKYVLSSTIGISQIDVAKGVGGGVPKLAIFRIEDINVPLPPLLEQDKIAAILSSVDDTIQATQAVIDQTHMVKQGLLQQLLTRGIEHTRFKQTEIGEIPEEWEISTISGHLIEYKSGAPLKPSDFTENGCKVIPKKAVVRGGKFVIKKEEQTYANEDFAKQYKNSIVDESYLITTLRDLVPSGPNIGLIVKINDDGEYILAQGVYGFKLKDSLYEDFLIQMSNSSEYRKIMNEIMVGSTQVHIRNADFFNLKIPLPPLEEQKNIAMILSEIDTQIECNKNYIFNLEKIKKGLMQDLLTGRVRVKLDEVNTT